jgi:hypothetical protein
MEFDEKMNEVEKKLSEQRVRQDEFEKIKEYCKDIKYQVMFLNFYLTFFFR